MSVITIAPLLKNEALAAAELFFETVHCSNSSDYSPDQLDAWAPSGRSHQQVIADKLTSQYTLAAKASNALIGFASLAEPDYLDMLFVHPRMAKARTRSATSSALGTSRATLRSGDHSNPRIPYGTSVLRSERVPIRPRKHCYAKRDRTQEPVYGKRTSTSQPERKPYSAKFVSVSPVKRYTVQPSMGTAPNDR